MFIAVKLKLKEQIMVNCNLIVFEFNITHTTEIVEEIDWQSPN